MRHLAAFTAFNFTFSNSPSLGFRGVPCRNNLSDLELRTGLPLGQTSWSAAGCSGSWGKRKRKGKDNGVGFSPQLVQCRYQGVQITEDSTDSHFAGIEVRLTYSWLLVGSGGEHVK